MWTPHRPPDGVYLPDVGSGGRATAAARAAWLFDGSAPSGRPQLRETSEPPCPAGRRMEEERLHSPRIPHPKSAGGPGAMPLGTRETHIHEGAPHSC